MLVRNDDSQGRDRGEGRTFRVSRLKLSAVLAISVLFALGGLLMVRSGAAFGWLVLVLFGLGSVVAGA